MTRRIVPWNLNLLRMSLLFVQAQKVMLTLFWYSEHVLGMAGLEATRCNSSFVAKSLHKHHFEYSALVPCSYILLSIMGFICVLIRHLCLMSIFVVLDLAYGVILFSNGLIDSIFVPTFTLLTVLLVCLYAVLLVKAQRNPIVEYGPSTPISSPEQSMNRH